MVILYMKGFDYLSNDDMDFQPELLSLTDDNGVEHNFEILDAIETDEGSRYMALLPQTETPDELIDSEGIYYIFQVLEEDGEEILTEVEDEALANELADIFEERFAQFDAMLLDGDGESEGEIN